MHHQSHCQSSLELTKRTALSLAALACTFSMAEAQIVQANYPLLTDLEDTTMNYGPLELSGTGPSNGVCVNGIYAFAPGGEDAATPNISTMDDTDFQIEVEFQIAALPTGNQAPILIGGNGWRFIGFSVRNDGTYGLLYNNAMREWSTSTLSVGTWYSGEIRYEAGDVELWLDGNLALEATIGPLNTNSNFIFTSNNFSNGSNHNCCLRNLVLSNDTTLGPISQNFIGTNYCTAVANSTGAPGVMAAVGSDLAVDNDVTLMASQLPPGFGIFVVSQMQGFTQVTNNVGNLCLGGTIGRYQVQNQIFAVSSTGTGSLTIDLGAIPQANMTVPVVAGDSWNFQAWHRDVVSGVVTSNFTDGLEITFM